MSDVLALIPARIGSKGIPKKNWTPLAGVTPVQRAIDVAVECTSTVAISTDHEIAIERGGVTVLSPFRLLYAPTPLHTDECPMIDVIKDALARIPGPPDQIIVLLQPTQPLRTPAHVQAAITRIETGEWDSVISITPIPRTHAPEFVVMYGDSTLVISPWDGEWGQIPSRRQAVPQPYVRDGTVYAFKRSTVERFNNIYGEYVSGLVIPTSETCPLDTMDDWAEAERRLLARG